MEEKKKSKKIIVISIVIAIMIISIVVAVIMLSNAEKLKLYNSTLELGKENYTEEIIKSDNVYVKEGYTYSVKDNKIDINNVGTYDLTFEIKGEGKTIEETKQIQVVDTTPPTVELKQDTFYIGDNINVEEIVKIQDLSQGEIPYKEANAKLEGQFDTSKEGESKVTISVTDKNGNTGTQELKVKVKNPKVNLYEYVKEKCNDSLSLQTGKNISIKSTFSSKMSGLTLEETSFVDFTEKVYKSVVISKGSYMDSMSITFIYFDNKLNATKIQKNYGYSNKVENIKLNSDEGKNEISLYKGTIDKIYSALEDEGRTIKFVGKTTDQLKKETIDLRELK